MYIFDALSMPGESATSVCLSVFLSVCLSGWLAFCLSASLFDFPATSDFVFIIRPHSKVPIGFCFLSHPGLSIPLIKAFDQRTKSPTLVVRGRCAGPVYLARSCSVCGNNPFVDIIDLGMGAQTVKKKMDEMAFFGAHLPYK
jgi:hypothetical protein